VSERECERERARKEEREFEVIVTHLFSTYNPYPPLLKLPHLPSFSSSSVQINSERKRGGGEGGGREN